MADHVAEQIVQAAKAALTGLVTTGANCFDSLVYPLQSAQLPALLVDQDVESSVISTLGIGRIYERTMDLLVVAKIEQNTNYRTVVNTIRKEVEIALAPGLTGAKYVAPKDFKLELSGEAV